MLCVERDVSTIARFFDKNKADDEIPHCTPSTARSTVYQHVVIFGYNSRSPLLVGLLPLFAWSKKVYEKKGKIW